MSRANNPLHKGPNRTVFFVIVGLALVIVLCGLTSQTVGWNRLCGGGMFVIGGIFLLLAEDKRWPVVILLMGLVLFFIDVLGGLLTPPV